jgi:threonyl-tRNA synthetase
MDKNEKLTAVRHSLAHLLAAAVLELWPETKNTIGPAIDTGFYYDFEFPQPISEKDFNKIEQKMREIVKTWKTFSHKEVTSAEARKHFAGNPYKLELIGEIEQKGEKITLYTSGTFTDLCRGGHVENADELRSAGWKLGKLAGAYWRGDEKNKQLTRIYGLAFATPADLAAHETMLAEAEKRDHRKLGRELDLFTFSELVGSGLPLFTPKGTTMRNALADFVWNLSKQHGYQRVWIPHMAKDTLYKTSGHYDKFADDIFYVKSKKSDDTFIMKPMNCPHHTQIYASQPRSYRDLPIRYSEVATVYRDENTGQLAGLSRVRSITQDDAHIFARLDQVQEEVKKIYDIIVRVYEIVGMPLRVRLSVNDPAHPEKYLGSPEVWTSAVDSLKNLLKDVGVDFELGVGEAAFYGPKIDFMAKDAIGREWQLATAQLDFVQPERFELEYAANDGTKQRPVMIHRAITGSLERFMGILIEHYAGNFPAWLAPVQAIIVPIGEKHVEYAETIRKALDIENIRVELDASNESLGKKIRAAKVAKIPYMLVIGDEELKTNTVTVESRDKGKIGPMQLAEFLQHIEEETKLMK